MTSTVTPHIVSTLSPSGSNYPSHQTTRSNGQHSTQSRGDDENSDETLPSDAYPPMNNDEMDTSRVMENLRRWEVAERQRRKMMREESAANSSSSVVGSITRLLWPGRRSSTGFGTHVVLPAQEHSGSSLSPSPISSPPQRMSEDDHPDNPFSDPPDSFSSFPDAQDQRKRPGRSSALGTLSSMRPTQTKPPKLTRSATISRTPPTLNQPNLPSAETPPPTINMLPYRSSSPTSIIHSVPTDDDQTEGRWWHASDWLCGCGEGPDRGGDSQAGRTNPFE